MNTITKITGREILDSRGNPTVEVDVLLSDGSAGRASVPSGASTGTHEAVEIRDNDSNRYNGKGVLQAVKNINGEIQNLLLGQTATDQRYIDQLLINADGTENKSRIGANAILGVSLAVAKASANYSGLPLYQYVGGVNAGTLPVPMFNVINGGKHANNAIDIQEFMVIPFMVGCFAEALAVGCEIYHALKKILDKAGHSTAVGDEGGFAPNLPSTQDAIELILLATEHVGLNPEIDIKLALDCASSEYFTEGKYIFSGENVTRSSDENITFLKDLTNNYPIISIEDGCAEEDWECWQNLTIQLGSVCQLVGDDLFVTNTRLLQKGINLGCANSLLVKVNQIGTLTETLQAVDLAHRNSYTTIMSHRSGETEDSTIADLAVATNCGQIKAGSTSRSDRLAKYNQLLRIEEELGSNAKYSGSRAFVQCYSK